MNLKNNIMTKKYRLFDFQDVIQVIRDKTSAITKKSDLVPGKVDFLKTLSWHFDEESG